MKKSLFLFLFLISLTLVTAGRAQARTHGNPEEKRPEPAFSLFFKTVFFGSHLPPAEKSKNQIFVLALLAAGFLGMILKLLGAEIPPPWASFWEIGYMACLLIYGAWILDLFSGLPWGWEVPTVHKVISAAALGLGVLAFMDHRAKTRRTLAPGFRKCPHCGEVIVLLAVECSFCHGKISS